MTRQKFVIAFFASMLLALGFAAGFSYRQRQWADAYTQGEFMGQLHAYETISRAINQGPPIVAGAKAITNCVFVNTTVTILPPCDRFDMSGCSFFNCGPITVLQETNASNPFNDGYKIGHSVGYTNGVVDGVAHMDWFYYWSDMYHSVNSNGVEKFVGQNWLPVEKTNRSVADCETLTLLHLGISGGN